ncbi:hypothetical protein HYV79_05030 [Candidatus Woesearchaeota archaeon]|nr:hypothetical protein [Candidatus Woesearchaeota archaeon]
MIDKKSFELMRKELEQFDMLREEVIKRSRDVLKKSKSAIYSLHRSDAKQAKEHIEAAKIIIKEIDSLLKKDIHLAGTGAYLESLEEYAEAFCYYSYLVKKTIPSSKEIGVDTETYLAGLCDLVGELVRKAINSSIKGDYKTSIEIKDLVSELYEELMQFDFRNTPLRRKFDSIKYGLEKLEDLILQLRIKEKL